MRKDLKDIWNLQVGVDQKIGAFEVDRPWSALWVRGALMRFNYNILAKALKADSTDYRATLYFFCMREFVAKCDAPHPTEEFYKAPDYEIAMRCLCKEKFLTSDDPFYVRGKHLYYNKIFSTVKGRWTSFNIFVAIVKYFDKPCRR